MKGRHVRRLALVLAICTGLGGARAAEAATQAMSSNLALDLIGAPDLQVMRPTSPATLTSEVLALFQDGAPRIGAAAFEITPWRLGAHRGITLEEYAADSFLANLLGSSLSYASVPDREGVRAAVALRIRLRDDTDWRLNPELIAEALRILSPLIPTDPRLGRSRDTPSPEKARSDASPDEAESLALKAAYDRHIRWNATQTSLGLGYSIVAPGGDLSISQSDGLGIWLSHAVGLGRRGQVVVSPRYTRYADRGAVSPGRHVLGAGTRVTYALEAFRLSVDAGLGAEIAGESALRGLVGAAVQYRLDEAEERWVEAGLTATFEGDQRRFLAKTGFAFGALTKPDFAQVRMGSSESR